MSVCDVCNRPVDLNGKQYTADQMRAAVRAGFRPPRETIDTLNAMYQIMGLSEEAVVKQWIDQIMNDTTDWMLCGSCSGDLESAVLNAKPAGACAFCKQPVYPHDQVAFLNESALNELVSIGAALHPGPPSGRDKLGTPRWVACMKCMGDIQNRAQRLSNP